MAQYFNYSFPEVLLAPGEEKSVRVELSRPFRASKLHMIGFMEEIRGHFKIRYSRLPPLNRENVIAYSNVTRIKSKRRTTVEYREGAKGNFVRSYRPENVVYVHTDALSYVVLRQIRCGKFPAMPGNADVPSRFFGAEAVFGNGIPMPTAHGEISVDLWNKDGDIPVKVYAAVFGIQGG